MFISSNLPSSSFARRMNMWEYLCAEFGLISLTILRLPTLWSTCCSSFARLNEYIGIPYAPSISDIYTMYAYLSLIRYVPLPYLFLTTVSVINSLTIFLITFPTPMRYHKCFREWNVIGRNITFRVRHRVNVGTPNDSKNQNITTWSI